MWDLQPGIKPIPPALKDEVLTTGALGSPLLCLFSLYASTSCEMPAWMIHKLESGLPGETSITSDTQMTPPLWQKARKNKEPLDESQRGK